MNRDTARAMLTPGRVGPYVVPGLFWLLAAIILLITASALPPDEDAAILFQYSQSLASSGVIAYNPADGPAEGATDFLFMVVIAIGDFLGANPYLAAAILSAAGLFVTLAAGLRTLEKNVWAVAAFCVILALAPMNAAAAGGFSNLLFGSVLFVAAMFATRADTRAFYLWGLFACLIRPDAIVPIATAFGCRLVWLGGVGGLRERRSELFALAAAVLAGIAYFLARWAYFGEFLPLPFMVKSACDVRVLTVCAASAGLEIPYAVLAFAAFGLSLLMGRPENRRLAITVFVSLCLLPLIFYAHVTLAQNVGYRFFYPIYLGAAFLGANAIHGLATGQRAGRRLAAIGLAVLAAVSALAIWRDTPDWWRTLALNQYMVSPKIARVMRDELPHGRMGVTEAGNLAYLSRWPTVDVWGLNTKRYAEHLIQPADVARENFDVLAVHGGWSTYEGYLDLRDHCQAKPTQDRSWQGMIDNIMIAMCDQVPAAYEIWFVPYYDPGEIARVGRLLNAPSPDARSFRFDAYFVKREYAGASALSAVLRNHGALTWDEYRARWCKLGVCR